MHNAKTVKDVMNAWHSNDHNLIFQGAYLESCVGDPATGMVAIKIDDGDIRLVYAHELQIQTCAEAVREEHNAKIESGELTVIYRRCPGFCGGRERRFELETKKVNLWRNGVKIQTLWPEMSTADREALISGMCNKCFAELFPPEAT
jgi:hypothetical protein